jgi:ankyrin repeat protein
MGAFLKHNSQTKSKSETALHLAAYYGQLSVVKLFLSLPQPADCTLVKLRTLPHV